MALFSYLLILFFHLALVVCQVEEFVSIDCGGQSNYRDQNTGLKWISDNGFINHGKAVEVGNPNGDKLQYQRRRDFPTDEKKYCYRLNTTERRRYLVRATFQYGNSNTGDPFPKFQLYLDATLWSTITVRDDARVYVEEMIIRASSNSIDVCLCCASTGSPFISTLELRPMNISMYATDYEDKFFLKVAARVNFGALSKDVIRYPDDPYDRIWTSDQEKKQNYLVGVAPGTERIKTSKSINTRTRELPPLKVMQTAVVGNQGRLSYRLDLEGFPATARAYAFFAEIEDLALNETRKFTMQQPRQPGYNNIVVNIAENANGSYNLYEPSYMNISLDFVLSFSFVKTRDSTHGPLLNAIEIDKYVPIIPKTFSQDKAVLDDLQFMSLGSNWTREGDPCIPTPWEWVTCSISVPPRITKILLSGRNLKGDIPSKLKNMDALRELWLDANSLSGTIPDLSNLVSLTALHLENNRLTGPLPSYLGDLPSLQGLYVQNNFLSGEIAPKLLIRNLKFNYTGNHDLIRRGRQQNFKLILGVAIGAFALFVLVVGSLLLLHNLRKKTSQQEYIDKSNSLNNISKPPTSYALVQSGFVIEHGLDASYHITLSELEEATQKFSKKIGKGSFGPVYYGRMKDGKEVAVKIMADISSHGEQQFVNEMDRNQRRRIPGPAGEWQAAMQRRENNPDDPILRRDFKTTQEFVVRAMEHDAKRAAAEDEDFRSPLWMNALQFAGHNHTSPTLDTIIKTRGKDHYRVSLVVAVIKTCTQNGLGDLIVTLKDPTGVIGGNIHRKVVADEEWAGKIGVGSIMVLEKVVVFSTSRTAQYLNITKPNVLKVFSPSTGEGSGTNGVSVVPTASQGLERPSGSLVVCQTERVQEQVSTMSTPDCGNEMNIAEQLTDEQVTQLLEDW